jgi:hypothetical protein
MRPGTLFAIARRDLLQELRGRRGLSLAGVTLAIVLPISATPVRRPLNTQLATIDVVGDVPPEVAADPRVRRLDLAGEDRDLLGRTPLRFEAGTPEDPALKVHARFIPTPVRAALDGERPVIRVERTSWKLPRPRRTALLALVSAAVLTGSVAESLAGERTRRTLDTLLTAAISRAELVTGKWLAWSAYGAGAAAVGALVAILGGNAEPGPWLLPLPFTAAATVALDLWLLRHAKDVITGATTSIRFMPLALTALALVAYGLGTVDPLLGAAVPIGGALMAAGALWEGWAPAFVATGSAATACAGFLWATAAALDTPEPLEEAPPSSIIRRGRLALVALACWWPALLTGAIWAAAGNEQVARAQSPGDYALAGALCLIAWWVVRRGAERTAPARAPGPPAVWPAAIVVGLVAGALWGPVPPTQPADAPLAALLTERLALAQHPAGPPLLVALLVALGQGLAFRGLIQTSAGPVGAVLIAVLVGWPHAPLWGLAWCGALSLLAWHARSPGPAILAHAVAVCAAAALAGLSG